LTLPETGISTNWLTDIKTLRTMIAHNTRHYGCAITSLVARLVGNLHGSALATWAISAELEELLDTMHRVEQDLVSLDDELTETCPEFHALTISLN
jgi:hypothetical protein